MAQRVICERHPVREPIDVRLTILWLEQKLEAGWRVIAIFDAGTLPVQREFWLTKDD